MLNFNQISFIIYLSSSLYLCFGVYSSFRGKQLEACCGKRKSYASRCFLVNLLAYLYLIYLLFLTCASNGRVKNYYECYLFVYYFSKTVKSVQIKNAHKHEFVKPQYKMLTWIYKQRVVIA